MEMQVFDLAKAARDAVNGALVTKAAMTRPIDDLGRVCIPKELRASLHWDRGDMLDVTPVDGGLLLTRNTERCACCGRPKSRTRLLRHGGIAVCEACFSKFEPEE